MPLQLLKISSNSFSYKHKYLSKHPLDLYDLNDITYMYFLDRTDKILILSRKLLLKIYKHFDFE